MEGEPRLGTGAESKESFMSDPVRYLMHVRMGLVGLFNIGLDNLSPETVEALQSLCDELLMFLYPDQGELTDAPSSTALAVGMLEASYDLMQDANGEMTPELSARIGETAMKLAQLQERIRSSS